MPKAPPAHAAALRGDALAAQPDPQAQKLEKARQQRRRRMPNAAEAAENAGETATPAAAAAGTPAAQGAGRGASSPVPVPRDLDHLVRLLHEELGDRGLDSEHVDVERVRAIMAAYESNERDWFNYAYFDRCRYTRNLIDDGNGCFNLMILAWGPGLRSSIHDHANCHCLMKILDGALIEETFEWPETDAGKPAVAFRKGENIKVPPTSDHSSDSDDVCAVDGKGKNVKVPRNIDHSSDSDDVCAIADGPRAKSCGLKKKWIREYNRDEVAYIHDKIGLHRVANSSASKPAVSLHLYTPPFSEVRTFTESGVARRSGTMSYYSVKGQKIERDFNA